MEAADELEATYGLRRGRKLMVLLNKLLQSIDCSKGMQAFRKFAQMFDVDQDRQFTINVARKFVLLFGPITDTPVFMKWLDELDVELQPVGPMEPLDAVDIFEKLERARAGASGEESDVRGQKMVTLCTDGKVPLFTLTMRNDKGEVEQHPFKIIYLMGSEKKFFVLDERFDVFNSFKELIRAVSQSPASVADSSSDDWNDTAGLIKCELGKFLSGERGEGPPELLDAFCSIHVGPSREQYEYVLKMFGGGCFMFRQSRNASGGVVITALNEEDPSGHDHRIIYTHVKFDGKFLFSLDTYSVCSGDLGTILTVLRQLCSLELNTLVCSDAQLCSPWSAIKSAGKSADDDSMRDV